MKVIFKDCSSELVVAPRDVVMIGKDYFIVTHEDRFEPTSAWALIGISSLETARFNSLKQLNTYLVSARRKFGVVVFPKSSYMLELRRWDTK